MFSLKKAVMLTACLALSKFACAQTWNLVWQDEFTNGISPDWVFETGTGSGGWGNNELQYYRTQNATVENGQLVITAKRENYGGMQYTSSRLKTQGRKSFKYGKIEARIAMPSAMGLWPAFWMLGDNISSVGWPACGEIDIMEHVNNSADVHGTIHWSDNNGNYASYGGHTGTNVTGYHVYSIEWNDQGITWYVDGNAYHQVNTANGINGTSEFHNNFFILLNMAVGGNWPGFNIDNNALPAKMYVDYVRVYQGGGNDGGGGGGNGFSKHIEAESYSSMAGVQTEACNEGGQNIGYIDNGDWMAYTNVNIPTSGNYLVEYRVAGNGGQLSLDLNGGSTVLGSLGVPATGGWQNWTTVSHTVYINAGNYSLGVYAQTGGWNLNWIKITSVSGALEAKKSIETSLTAGEIDIYPNPATDKLNINLPSVSTGTVKIVNTAGQTVINTKLSENAIDVSSLKTGVYTIQVETQNTVTTKRFIKK